MLGLEQEIDERRGFLAAADAIGAGVSQRAVTKQLLELVYDDQQVDPFREACPAVDVDEAAGAQAQRCVDDLSQGMVPR